jgi:hypothetical protein
LDRGQHLSGLFRQKRPVPSFGQPQPIFGNTAKLAIVTLSGSAP